LLKHPLCVILALGLFASPAEQTQPAGPARALQEEGADPLPSWQDNKLKQRIVAFVKTVTDKNSADYVPPEDRIATFDNDGTLWCEQPLYPQVVFALDRVKALAPK